MDISSIALQGLEAAQMQVERSGRRLAGVGASSPEGADVDTVDLSAEAVALLSASKQFAANVNVLKVADNMQKNLVNLLG